MNRVVLYCFLIAGGAVFGDMNYFTGAVNYGMNNAGNWSLGVIPEADDDVVVADWITARSVAQATMNLTVNSVTLNNELNGVTDAFQLRGGNNGTAQRFAIGDFITVNSDVTRNITMMYQMSILSTDAPGLLTVNHYGSGTFRHAVSTLNQQSHAGSVKWGGNNLNMVQIDTSQNVYSGSTTFSNISATVSGVSPSSASGPLGTGIVILQDGSVLALTGSAKLGNSQILVNSGTTLDVSGMNSGIYTNSAILQGSGTVVGDIWQTGQIRAGGGTATFTFEDDITMTASSWTQFEINPDAGVCDILAGNGDNRIAFQNEADIQFAFTDNVTNGASFTVLTNWGDVAHGAVNFDAIGLGPFQTLDYSQLFSAGTVTVIDNGNQPQLAMSFASTNAVLCWEGVSNLTYNVQFCDDLVSGNWTNVEGEMTGEGTLCVTNEFSGPNGFYRIYVEQ
ncbi:autotransporter outer membrane beta-barrel domain-containing protein [Tichowtungia aerotolerans]|uniref:Uncharacterized protein n=1 Tax=Tichowtungia aerotolerans TaxID=2697043 RepID=A0A6P1M7F1_9BACT|nr:hypothetical protein [Tichowtungia aerotolerans]QHI69787.1 hypothetical protein GT409_10110 [Tichowtungia aerotolerans]